MIKKIVLFMFCLVLCHSAIARAASSDIAKIGTDATIEAPSSSDDFTSNVQAVFGDGDESLDGDLAECLGLLNEILGDEGIDGDKDDE